MAAPKTIFVTPWYGFGKGGAEVFCRGLAGAVAAHGRQVEVYTTCCRNPFEPWDRDALPPGESRDGQVIIHRFPVDGRDAELYAHFWRSMDQGVVLTDDEEFDLIANSINSAAMMKRIAASRPGEARFVFLPYLYGTTIRGMLWARPDEAILIPCLHPEPFAFLGAMHDMFGKARGCLFLSGPEEQFARSLYGIPSERTLALGGGVDDAAPGNGPRFRQERNITAPYILFVGRKVPGKGADVLLQHFARYVGGRPDDPLQLVMIGAGSVEIPRELRARVHSLTADTSSEVFDAMAGCEALVHPSLFESFSIVMMEAWLHGRPVMVNGSCEVTLWHAVRSGGGLWFTDGEEFCEAVARLRNDGSLARGLGAAGRDYVRRNYLWADVAKRFDNYLAALDAADNARGKAAADHISMTAATG